MEQQGQRGNAGLDESEVTMKKRILKGTELELSSLCLGTGNFGGKLDYTQSFELLDRFRDIGGSFIDTANVYCKWIPGMNNSSEQYIGAWLKSRRAYHDVVIATKGGHYDFSAPDVSRVNRADVVHDLNESLKTLDLDHIDLYWLHRDDENKDIGEILELMEELAKEGKIRYYGASNFKRKRLEEARKYAASHGMKGFCAVSNQWSGACVNPGKNLNDDESIVIMDMEMYRWHEEWQVPMVPFSSSAYGFFSKLKKEGVPVPEGEVTREDVMKAWNISAMPEKMKEAYMNERNLRLYGILCRASEDYGVSVYSMTQAYFLNRPFQVFPVGAVSGTEQLADFSTAGELELDDQLIRTFGEFGVEI
jgi:aryl-alcohol dehydrogenase-like predicted oxidoreductase